MVTRMLYAIVVTGFCGTLLAADAFTRTWRLDLVDSTFASDNPAPKALTLTFSEQGVDRTQVLKGVAADGRPTTTVWTAPMTGGTAKFIEGTGPNGGARVEVVGGTTLVMTQNTTPGASRTYRVTPNGRTLTLIQRTEDGRERARMIFRRE